MKTFEVRDVVYTRQGRRILDGITLSLEAGALVGLIGPNGAGKSTLLKIVAGLRRPDAGAVEVDGRDVAAYSAAERGRFLGYVPQHFEPAWDYTVRDVVDLGVGRAPEMAHRVPQVIADQELDGLLAQRWSRLSGGERARALLAAVLVADPPLLLADEPAAGLDVRHRLDLLTRLKQHAEGRFMVVVMHDLETALRVCDRIIVLDRGKVALDGPAREVALDRKLDAIFAVSFQRVPFDPTGGPLLPDLERAGRRLQ